MKLLHRGRNKFEHQIDLLTVSLVKLVCLYWFVTCCVVHGYNPHLHGSFISGQKTNLLFRDKFLLQSHKNIRKAFSLNVTKENITSESSVAIKEIDDVINKFIHLNDIILFMKGTPQEPKCGFSNTVVQILRSCLKGDYYKYVDVLTNDQVRERIKVITGWPTIPQLFISGEFIGGCDIVIQMFKDGTLQELLNKIKSKN